MEVDGSDDFHFQSGDFQVAEPFVLLSESKGTPQCHPLARNKALLRHHVLLGGSSRLVSW